MKAEYEYLWPYRAVALCVLIVLVLFGFLGFMQYRQAGWQFDDLKGTTRQAGVAMIESIQGPQPSGNADCDYVPPQIIVRFRGRLCLAGNVIDLARLRVGQQARIEYRVGKSGQIYVDQVSPIGTGLTKSRAKVEARGCKGGNNAPTPG